MTVRNGRQYATALNEIRTDHVERYRFAAHQARGTVADLGCGIGYGSNIMAKSGLKVAAYERSSEAIAFGKQHWNHPNITWVEQDLESGGAIKADWAACFEVIEHLKHPETLLRAIEANGLIASVPNQDVMPFDQKRHSYHFRHYTHREFGDLLTECCWRVHRWHGQAGKHSPVTPGANGMTLVAVCERA